MEKNDLEAPLMPTGSSTTDLDIAQEQDALAGEQALSDDLAPTDAEVGGPEGKTEAHPS